jgi:hypothetical protein
MLIVEKSDSNDVFFKQFEQSLNNVYNSADPKIVDAQNTAGPHTMLLNQQKEQKPQYIRKTVVKYNESWAERARRLNVKHVQNHKLTL